MVFLFPSLAMGETMDDLVYRESDNSYYEKFTNVPFSGTVKGQDQGKIKNGMKEGPWFEYDTDGTVIKWLTGTFKNGVKVD